MIHRRANQADTCCRESTPGVSGTVLLRRLQNCSAHVSRRPVKTGLHCLQQTMTRLNKDASLSNHIPAYASVDTAGNESPTGYEPAISTEQYGWYGRGERI
jgi:hypothetical protein